MPFKHTANILRHAALGDVLYAEPMIRSLRESGDYDLIKFHTWWPFGQVFLNHPALDNIEVSEIGPKGGVLREIPYEETSYCLDWVYENQWRMGRDTYVPLAYMQHFNLKPPNPCRPLLFITEAEKALARCLLLTDKKKLAICPSGRVVFKDEEWDQVVKVARDIGFFLVGLGLENKQHMNLNVDMRGRTSVRDMCVIMSEVDAVLVLESGSLVVADALGKPGVGLLFHGSSTSMLRPESKIRVVPCHDHRLDYKYLKRPEIATILNYHLKVEAIAASLREVASTII
jgi:hypothetical protein